MTWCHYSILFENFEICFKYFQEQITFRNYQKYLELSELSFVLSIFITIIFEIIPFFENNIFNLRRGGGVVGERFCWKAFLLMGTYQTSNNQHDWIPLKYLDILHHNSTQNHFPHWPCPLKTIMPICQNLDVLHPNSIWDIVKILQTHLFKYYENVWLCPSIIMLSPCRKIGRPKCWNKTEGNFDIYLYAKNQLHL